MWVRTVSRRQVLRAALAGTGLIVSSNWLSGCDLSARSDAADRTARGLGDPDDNGVCLPPGFTSRIVARSGQPPAQGSQYAWHGSPDGGACFPTAEGGWIYVSNSELPGGQGGAGALRFDAQGAVVEAYPILRGTSLNCAGGATPWGTWLSCEEFPGGRVWECDPTGRRDAVVRPALGVFSHEAVAVDPVAGCLYLTEDAPNGRFYRFTPVAAAGGRLDLGAGTLDVAAVGLGDPAPVRWLPVPDPSAARTATARQVAESTAFPGGEGIAWGNGLVYFTTKYDNCVWAFDPRSQTIRVIYDDDRYPDPVLTGVDNVVVAPSGKVVVAEDGGDMQLVAITPAGDVYPIAQVATHVGSEIAGPAFDPSGARLYFSSQRGPHGRVDEGITFEIAGPFATA
jgi:secreted PhoX family phosphatase